MFLDLSRPRSRGWVRLAAGVGLAFALAAAGPPAVLAENARDELQMAQDLFLVADFSHALEKVDSLLESGVLSGGAARDAWVLKARCEAGLAHRSAAMDAYCEALRVDASWRPDPDLFTTDEVALFEQARPGCRPEEAPSPLPPPASVGGAAGSSAGGKAWYQKKSTWAVAGGVVVAGILAGVLAGGGDDDAAPGTLAGFPPPPAGAPGVIR